MRAHLIMSDSRADWVITRLAAPLIERNGWTSGPMPDQAADVNILFPYLEINRFGDGEIKTKLAGYFTHRRRGGTSAWWQRAARACDLRITAARLWNDALKMFGDSLVIPHPVDTDHFTVADRPKHERPRVGVSGMVYRGGRKGEDLLLRLSKRMAERYDFVASGSGWPVPTQHYAWADMPSYYQGLDVFLCTSTNEGGPVTMLEALACGVPVVIPSGVGACDDLPDIPGIRHYEAGNIEAMIDALEQTLSTDVDPQVLREIVRPFTAERWALEWYDALHDLVHPAEIERSRPNWQSRAGIYVVAFRPPARRCAQRLLASIDAHMPEMPVALCGDKPTGLEDTYIYHADGPTAEGADIGGRSAKTRMDDLAPAEWRYVLYLDADTELIGSVAPLYQILQDGWDVVVSVNPGKYHTARAMLRPDNHDECEATFEELGGEELLQLQGGVVGFYRNDRTARFLRLWHEEWQRWGKRDQAALLRAAHKSDIRLFILGNEWNTSLRYLPRERSAAIIHHQMEARSHTGIVNGRNDSREAWEAVKREGYLD